MVRGRESVLQGGGEERNVRRGRAVEEGENWGESGGMGRMGREWIMGVAKRGKRGRGN